MSQTLNCPSCGAAVEYTGTGRTIKCPYCGTLIQVPEDLWQPVEEAKTVNQWKNYFVIFLVITVVLPTCLGLLGAILGVGGSIFAVILPFFLRFFIH